MSRTITAAGFQQKAIDKLASSIVYYLREDATIEEWTEGRVYRGTGAVKEGMFNSLPCIFVIPSLLPTRRMPDNRERNRAVISLMVFWEEYSEFLEDIDEPTIASVVQHIKVVMSAARFFDELYGSRLVERLNEIRVVDFDGGVAGDNDRTTLYIEIELEFVIDYKVTDQEIQ